jgi:5-methylcytosine-specific restriction enzyme A
VDEEDGQLVNPMELNTLQDVESGDPYIRIDELKKLGGFWSPQRGGMEIPNDIAIQLEQLWSVIINSNSINGSTAGEPEFDSPANDLALPGESAEVGGLEGGKRSVLVTRTERNPKNREACLNHWGYQCRVCGFDFGREFGDDAKDYIHVHHHNLVASAGEIVPDPIHDMSPLCPNCHAVAHLKRPPYSIDELKKMRSATRSRT